MSAIVGIYNRDQRPVSQSSIDEMLARMAHRGIDGRSRWCEDHVGLGQAMLRTTPESLTERLPLVDQAANLVITADARIDNREELLCELYDLSGSATNISDSELILAGYKKWGHECPSRFVGDFAFAIWDRNNQEIFCARDHFGLRPFHYYLSDKCFVFATEIKALFCLPEVPRRLNELRIADFLSGIDEDKEITSYVQILRLAPGHSLVVGKQDSRLVRYWQLDPLFELRLGSNEEYAEAFREQFTEAVRCRMRSAFPVGSMLSGGLDSSSITCVARNISAVNRKPLETFSAIYDKVKECDERPFINSVLSQNGVNPNYVHPDELSPLEDFERVVWHLDDPIVAGNQFIQWGLCRAVAKKGVRVVLDGFDGDTTVSHGTGYLVELARTGRWFKLGREARGYASHFKNVSPSEMFWWYLQRYWLNPNMPQGLKPLWRKVKSIPRRLRPSQPNKGRMTAFPEILNQDFARRIGMEQRRQAMKKVRADGPLRTERQAHHSRLVWSLMTATLESLNKVGAAFGVEYRFPFFDKRLAEFCLSLPPEQKLNRGWNRVVMRRAMEGILPKEVQWRGGKGDMTANFERGMHAERSRIEDVIISHPEALERYVDIAAIRAAHERFVDNQAGESDVLAIWRSVSLALWLRSTEINP